VVAKIEVWMCDEELAYALQAVLSGAVSVVGRFLDGGGRPDAIAEID